MTDAGANTNFSAADNSAWFKVKPKINGKTAANGRTDVEIVVPLKHLSSFWKTLELS